MNLATFNILFHHYGAPLSTVYKVGNFKKTVSFLKYVTKWNLKSRVTPARPHPSP